MTFTRHRLHSLPAKLFISIIAWIIGAVLFIGLSLNLSWELETGGVDINDAGSLRMRTYHMTALASQENRTQGIIDEYITFNTILASLEKNNMRAYWFIKPSQVVHEQIIYVGQTLNTKMVPMFLAASKDHTITAEELAIIDAFIVEIHRLVKYIEIENTNRIKWLRFLQFFLIGMVIISAVIAVYFLILLVIRPLNQLHTGIIKIGRGNYSTRIESLSKDEFGEVARGFNAMAKRLENVYNMLEFKVTEKTAELEARNKELGLLYEVTSFLHETNHLELMTTKFLEYLITLCGAEAGSIRLFDTERGKMDYVSSIGLPEHFINTEYCSSIKGCYCGQAMGGVKPVEHEVSTLNKQELVCRQLGFTNFIIFHVGNDHNDIGILTLYFYDQNQLKPQEIKLIKTLSNQLYVAIINQRLALRDRQFAVVEERNFMAQGLHDSIAQSLSYLNLQAQMMESAVNDHNLVDCKEHLGFIREGIQESYDDVRELLLNFRIRIEKEDFMEAIQSLLKRFERQVSAKVTLTNIGTGPNLDPQQQLQVLFILQEALSNIRKHAKAQCIDITLKKDQEFVLIIEDDGVGFDRDKLEDKQLEHVGMIIMQERASRINAMIDITTDRYKGTKITLTLPESERNIG